MTINPLDIPCAYCNGKGEKYESIEYGVEISCYSCEVKVFVDDWITGGINALVGKLARRGVHIEDMSYGKDSSWAWASDKGSQMGTSFKTFEACVLDAWEKLKREKNENSS